MIKTDLNGEDLLDIDRAISEIQKITNVLTIVGKDRLNTIRCKIHNSLKQIKIEIKE